MLIDLTSLLDVIFIILLIVMWGQNTVETNLKQAQAETEAAKTQTEEERKLYEQQLEISDNINQYVFAVSVVVPYDKEDVTHRTIQILKEGEEIEVFIKSLDKEKQKISLGCKKEEDNPWTKFMENYKVGDIATGTVVRLVPFGAFVDIGGVDGLIHISDISWRRINHPSEVLSEGQSVEVVIKNIDEEKQKISLGYKRIEDNPWEIFKSKYSVGDTVKAKVVRIASFGAFAEIIEGVDGLIHISQISYDRINAVADALKPGDEVEAQIIEIKEDDGKVSLSIKALLTPPEKEEVAEVAEEVEEDLPMSVGTEVEATQFELAVEEAESKANAAE